MDEDLPEGLSVAAIMSSLKLDRCMFYGKVSPDGFHYCLDASDTVDHGVEFKSTKE